MKTLRYFALSLTAVAFFTFAPVIVDGPVRAQQGGVHLTANGYRVPVYGASLVTDADGHVGTSCAQLTTAQIDGLRFTRSVSRTMLATYPRSIVQATTGVTAATFEIIYTDAAGTGFLDPTKGAVRRGAMIATVAAWSAVLQGTVPIVIQAGMKAPEDPASTTLASAGPVDFASIDGRLVPSALASQLRGGRSGASPVDIEVNVNPTVDWDYAFNGVAAANKPSFVYTMIHEVGHGLGFLSTFELETGAMLNPLPTPYDVFINRGSSSRNPLTSRSSDQVKEDLVGGNLFFAGPKTIEASARSIRPLPMVKLFAPNPYEPGSSISHVDQETYADFKTGLMAPKDFGSGTDKIDILTLGVMEDMGYKLVPDAVTARVTRR